VMAQGFFAPSPSLSSRRELLQDNELGRAPYRSLRYRRRDV
jgi:hypothetical protein